MSSNMTASEIAMRNHLYRCEVYASSGIAITSNDWIVTGNVIDNCHVGYQRPEPTVQDDLAEWKARLAELNALPFSPQYSKAYAACADAFDLISKRIEKINGWT